MTNIDWAELFLNAFSRQTIATQLITRIINGTYCVQLAWDKQGLPCNQQIIWILYHPKSSKPIQKTLQELQNTANQLTGYTTIIENYDPSTHFIPTILLLSDGSFTAQSLTINLNDHEGHLGLIVGQGRAIDTDEPVIIGTIGAICSNIFLGVKTLNKDPFLTANAPKLEEMKKIAQKHGAPMSTMTQKEAEKTLNMEADR